MSICRHVDEAGGYDVDGGGHHLLHLCHCSHPHRDGADGGGDGGACGAGGHCLEIEQIPPSCLIDCRGKLPYTIYNACLTISESQYIHIPITISRKSFMRVIYP